MTAKVCEDLTKMRRGNAKRPKATQKERLLALRGELAAVLQEPSLTAWEPAGSEGLASSTKRTLELHSTGKEGK